LHCLWRQEIIHTKKYGRNPSLLIGAIVYGDAKLVTLLLDAGADRKTAYVFAKALHSQEYSPELIMRLDTTYAAKLVAPRVEAMERDEPVAVNVSEVFQRRNALAKTALGRNGKKTIAFLSHMQKEGGDVAAHLHEKLQRKFGVAAAEVFIDTENLRDLGHLIEDIKATCVVVVLLTKNLLARPW